MKVIALEPDFAAWRIAARDALQAGYQPADLDLQDATAPTSLALSLDYDSPTGTPIPRPHTSRAFLEAAELASVHRDPQRWNLLYRILYRLQTSRDLLQIETDDDVAALLRLKSQVARDLHKMHAFLRFRKVLEPGDPTPAEQRPIVLDEPVPFSPDPDAHRLVLATTTPFGAVRTEIETCAPSSSSHTPAEQPGSLPEEACEHFIAWYQPDHRILPLAAPFFTERFAIMRWTILTPDASVSWNPATRQLTWSPGLPRESAPAEDELEDLWRSYYASIFNPARVNPEAMRSEMPVRYWKNLPEIALLPNLLQQASKRVDTMVTRQQQAPTAEPFVPKASAAGTHPTLEILQAAMPACRGCDLYCNATQVVPGRGPVHASLMMVGEQPGDQEDLQGLPFVGPAGKVLDRAFSELGIDRASLFLTNAVKHFKWIPRGKVRLHQNPRMSEIMACRPWLLAEIEAVRPRLVLCLGASASKSLLGGTFALMRDRGKVLPTPHAGQVMATIHPSAVLRGRDEQSRRQLFQFLKQDLALAHQTVTTAGLNSP